MHIYQPVALHENTSHLIHYPDLTMLEVVPYFHVEADLKMLGFWLGLKILSLFYAQSLYFQSDFQSTHHQFVYQSVDQHSDSQNQLFQVVPELSILNHHVHGFLKSGTHPILNHQKWGGFYSFGFSYQYHMEHAAEFHP